jgi:hypothetical protein
MFYEDMIHFELDLSEKININQTAQITVESRIIIKFSIETEFPCEGKVQFRPAPIY